MSVAISPQAITGTQTISLQPPGNQQTVAFIELNNLCPFALEIGLPSDTRYLMPGVSATYGYPASNTPLVITALGGSNQQGQFSGVWLYNDDPMPMNVTSSGVTTPASTIVIPQTQTQTVLPPSYFSTNINTGEAPYAEETTTIVEMDTTGYNAVLVNITPNGASSDYPAFPLSYVFQWKLSQYLNGNLIASNSAFGFPFDATNLITYYQPTGPNYQDVIPIFGNSISLSLYNSQAATSGQPMPYNIVLQLLNINQPTSSLLTFARKISMGVTIEIPASSSNHKYPSWVVPFTKRQCTLMASLTGANILFSIQGATFGNPLIGGLVPNVNLTTGTVLTTELSMINDLWTLIAQNSNTTNAYLSLYAAFVL